MKTSRLVIVGFGNVGQGFVQILSEQAQFLAEQFNVVFRVVAVNDLRFGSLYDPHGLPLQALLAAGGKGDLSSVPAAHYDWSVDTMLVQADADTLVETSYTDLRTGEPALTYIRQALSTGKHVVTTNKGPIALCFPELKALAVEHQVRIGYEGTVMSGTPTIALGRKLLAAARIRRIQGILNGTTNFILTRMEDGGSYAEALAEAQALGYAEADPTGDVEGFDAAGKVVILCNILMGSELTMADVDREGITRLTQADIQHASQRGECWKLIGTIEKEAGQVKASVRPTALPSDHPLANVKGALNAVTYTTDLLGDITLIGPGAGRIQTGYALLNDLLTIHGRVE
jgi:homoserine dehydrogenase